MKKFLAAVLAMAMALSLVSFASAEETYTIGLIGPLTGAAAVYGQAVLHGAEIAVEEINAQGGAQIVLLSQDDEHDAEKSVNAYNNVLDGGAQFILGAVTTSPCIAVAAQAYEDRVFMLTPSASSTDVTANKDNMYQVCFTDPAQGIASAQLIADKKLGAKIGIIYNSSDAYSTGIYNAFKTKAEELGLEIVAAEAFASDDNADFSVQLSACKNGEADLVFMPIYYTPASLILKQAKDMGYAPTFFGVDGMDGILTMEGFDPSLAEGLMLLTPFSATVPETKSFVDAYVAANGVQPNQFAADAYDGVYIVKEALEKAGCTADMSSADICEALVAQMTQISYSGLTGKDMTWNAEGQVSKAPTAYVIKDGEYVLPEA